MKEWGRPPVVACYYYKHSSLDRRRRRRRRCCEKPQTWRDPQCVCVCVVETGLGRRLDGPPTLPKHKLRLPIMSMLPTAHSLQNSQTSCLLFKNKNRFCTSPEKTIHYFNNRRVKQRNGQIRLKLFKMKKRDVSRVPRRGTSSKWSRKSRPMKIVFRFRCKVSREGDY